MTSPASPSSSPSSPLALVPGPRRARLRAGDLTAAIYRLDAVTDRLDELPFTVKVLLENVLRNSAIGTAGEADVAALAAWRPGLEADIEIPFMPGRVLLQDFTGVPAVVDLAAMRDAMAELGGDPARINPLVPASLVIDHSVQVDRFGTAGAYAFNVEREYERNGERYQLLRWAQTALRGFRVVPPGTGIVHQVNLEHLADVVSLPRGRERRRRPGGLPRHARGHRFAHHHDQRAGRPGLWRGWHRGRGGAARPAALPAAAGVSSASACTVHCRPAARPPTWCSSSASCCGPTAWWASSWSSPATGWARWHWPTAPRWPTWRPSTAPRRASSPSTRRPSTTCASPGATRPASRSSRPTPGSRACGACRAPRRDSTRPWSSTWARSARPWPDHAGPRTGWPWPTCATASGRTIPPPGATGGYPAVVVRARSRSARVSKSPWRRARWPSPPSRAARTPPTRASWSAPGCWPGMRWRVACRWDPPSRPAWRPGSRAVTAYLRDAGLLPPLERWASTWSATAAPPASATAGHWTTAVAEAVESNDLVVAAVLSGNRNFEGRIHPLVRASYLASPPLVVAFALAGRVDIDLEHEPLGAGSDGQPVMLSDLWPSADEIAAAIGDAVTPELFRSTYASVFEGDERWRALPVPAGDRYAWDATSTYIAAPPFFRGLTRGSRAVGPHRAAPASWPCWATRSPPTTSRRPATSRPGALPASGCSAHGVSPVDFNSYGARRGHHEVMMRGTFGNIRLRNALASARGPLDDLPAGRRGALHLRRRDALPGRARPCSSWPAREYGSGSSRDWAAKGTRLLGRRPCWPSRSSASIAPTWWAWASCPCSSCPARASPAWA